MNSKPPEGRGKGPLIAVFLVCLAPVVAAFIAFYFFPPSGHVNYGDLLEPRSITDVAALQPALGQLKGKWVYVQIDHAACDMRCEAKLYNMRQTRVAQGKEMDRVERLWLVLDRETPNPDLQGLHEGVHKQFIDARTAAALFPAGEDVRDHVYLIDPLGNLMLRFPKNAEPKRMIKDMQRLLKVSRVG